MVQLGHVLRRSIESLDTGGHGERRLGGLASSLPCPRPGDRQMEVAAHRPSVPARAMGAHHDVAGSRPRPWCDGGVAVRGARVRPSSPRAGRPTRHVAPGPCRTARAGRTRPAAKEARLAGIRKRSKLSLETVERRRLQLWGIAFVVMACLALGITLLGSDAAGPSTLTRLPGVRYGEPLMIVGLFAYLVEKEAHLRRLSLLLIAERVSVEREQGRLAELLEVDRVNTALASDMEYEVTRSLGAVIERLRTVRERRAIASPLDATLASV